MADTLVEFLQKIVSNNYLIVLLVAMVPLIELKGAIPIGEKLGLQLIESAPLAFVGSTLICIPVFFLLIPIFNLLKKIGFIKKLVEKIETVFRNKAKKLAAKAEGDSEKAVRKIFMLGLFIFVAIPFPVTGIWTGTAIAVFLNMRFRDAILPLAVGNFVAGTFITLMTLIFKDYVDIIIYCLFAIAIIMLIIFIIKVIKADAKAVENGEACQKMPNSAVSADENNKDKKADL